MRTYTQLIEYWLRIATTATITLSTWGLLQVRYFQIVKFLYLFFIKIVLHFNINAIPQWRSKRGAMGRSAPGVVNLGVENEEKKGGCAKKNSGVTGKKPGGAANLRPAPGGRYPSYATAISNEK